MRSNQRVGRRPVIDRGSHFVTPPLGKRRRRAPCRSRAGGCRRTGAAGAAERADEPQFRSRARGVDSHPTDADEPCRSHRIGDHSGRQQRQARGGIELRANANGNAPAVGARERQKSNRSAVVVSTHGAARCGHRLGCVCLASEAVDDLRQLDYADGGVHHWDANNAGALA